MVTVKIKETTPQAKALIAMLKTLSYVEIEPNGLSRPAVKARKVAKFPIVHNADQKKILANIKSSVKFIKDVKAGKKQGRPIQSLLDEI